MLAMQVKTVFLGRGVNSFYADSDLVVAGSFSDLCC
jgi:hypothetical protein